MTTKTYAQVYIEFVFGSGNLNSTNVSLVSPVELNYKLWVQVSSLVSKPGGRPGARGGGGGGGGGKKQTNSQQSFLVMRKLNSKLVSGVSSLEEGGGRNKQTRSRVSYLCEN